MKAYLVVMLILFTLALVVREPKAPPSPLAVGLVSVVRIYLLAWTIYLLVRA